MAEPSKHERPEQTQEPDLKKEFVPYDRSAPLSAGRLIVRQETYGSSLSKFDTFFEVMAEDTLRCDPPFELSRGGTDVVQYAGVRYAGTYGLEATIPEGHVIPTDYTRIPHGEATK